MAAMQMQENAPQNEQAQADLQLAEQSGMDEGDEVDILQVRVTPERGDACL